MSARAAPFSPSIAAGSRGWVGRALLVLAASLLAHAIVLHLAQRALRVAPIGFGDGALIEVSLHAPEPVARPTPKETPPPKVAPPRAAKPKLAPPPTAPATALEDPTLPEESEAATAPEPQVEEPQPTVAANSERAAPDTAIVGEFDAGGESLLAELEKPPLHRAFLPVSARYVYQTTDTRFAAVNGTTTVNWRFDDDGSYFAHLVTAVFGLTVLELKSAGRVHPYGLAPQRYTERTVGRAEWATNFDWNDRRVTFSAKNVERTAREGMQDRLSFQFQLMALGQRLLDRFRPGSAIVLAVGGRDEIATYRFHVIGPERLRTGAGEYDTVKLERPASADRRDTRIEVWLAPEAAWLPVKLRFTDRRGEVTENLLAEAVIPSQ